jgi:hypothetical protein
VLEIGARNDTLQERREGDPMPGVVMHAAAAEGYAAMDERRATEVLLTV